MTHLLDTHNFLWFINDDSALSATAKALIEDPENVVYLSVASIWEIAIKVGLGKLTLSLPYRQWMAKAINDLGLSVLPITIEYADVQASLPPLD